MSPLVVQVVGAAVLPFIAALVIGCFASKSADKRGAFVAPLGLGAAYLVTHWWTQGVPDWPYIGVVMGLAYFAMAATLAGCIAGKLRPVGLVGMLGLAAVGTWILFAFHREANWTGSAVYVNTGLVAIGALVVTFALDRGPDQLPRAAGAVFVIVTGCLAVALGLSSTASLGQLAGGISAGCAGLFAAGLFRGPLRFSAGANVVLVLMFGALVLAGQWAAELKPWPAYLSLGALAAVGPGMLLLDSKQPGLVRSLGWLIPIALGVAAVVLAYSLQPEPSPYY